MQTRKYKIWHFLILLGIIISNPYSCGDEYILASESDCDSCYTDKPDTGSIKISLSEDKCKEGVILNVYKGKYIESMANDDSKLVYYDTTYKSEVDIDVKVNEYYSVVAQYLGNSKKYSVVDGDNIKVYSIKSTCNFDCWIIRGGSINCRLRF